MWICIRLSFVQFSHSNPIFGEIRCRWISIASAYCFCVWFQRLITRFVHLIKTLYTISHDVFMILLLLLFFLFVCIFHVPSFEWILWVHSMHARHSLFPIWCRILRFHGQKGRKSLQFWYIIISFANWLIQLQCYKLTNLKLKQKKPRWCHREI